MRKGWTVIKLGATVSAAMVLLTAAWSAGDYTGVRPIIKKEFLVTQAQLDQTNNAVLLIQFQLLMQKREYGGLTYAEQIELARIAQALGYIGVPGCGT